MIVTVKADNCSIAFFGGVAVTGMIMSMAGIMIVIAVIMLVIVPRMVVAIGLVRMMIMSAAASMIAVFDLWHGGIALWQRDYLIPQSRDPLGEVGSSSGSL